MRSIIRPSLLREAHARVASFIVVLAFVVAASSGAPDLRAEGTCQPFVRGDANTDGGVDIADPIAMLQFTFLGQGSLSCLKASDANADGSPADISDAIFILLYSFSGGSPPPAPFPGCGVVPEDGLSCESYPACPGFDGCDPGPGESFEWFELDGTAVPEDLTPPDFRVIGDGRVVPGEPLTVEVAGLGIYGPAEIDWGDGSDDSVSEDGAYVHSYDRARDASVRLVDRFGGVHGLTTVQVVAHVSVSEVFFGPAGDGGGMGLVIAVDPFVCSTVFQIPDPVQRLQIATACGLFLPGDLGPETAVTFVTNGEGHVVADCVLGSGQGGFEVLQHIEFDATVDSRPMTFPLPPLPTDGLGIHRVRVEVHAPEGPNASPAATATYSVVDPALVSGDPDCDQIRRLYLAAVQAKEKRKNDCESLRQALAALKAELAGAETDLGGLQTELAGANEARAAAQSEADDLASAIQAFLGGTGTLADSADSTPPGQSYAGVPGAGIIFSDAGALLARADEVEASTGSNPLADVAKLGKVRAKIDALDAQIAGLEAEAAALQARIANLNAQIAALEAALADCERECAQMEQEIKDLEEAEKKCLEELAKRRRAEQAIQEADDAIRDATGKGAGAGSRADDADDAIDESAGSPDELGGDHEKVDEARGAAGAGDEKTDCARRKLEEAREALAAGDSERAAELAREAKECAGQAAAEYTEADRILDEAERSAAGRGKRQCVEGETYASEWVERRVPERIISFQVVPADQKPEEWNAHVERLRDAVNDLVTFINLVEALKDASVIEGTITPEADKAVVYIFETYLELITDRAGVDVYALIEGSIERSRSHSVCRNGRWVLDHVETEIVGPERWQEKIGTVLNTGPSRKKEVSDLIERYVRRFLHG